MPGIPQLLTMERSSETLGKETFISSWLMSLSRTTLRIVIFWSVHQVGSDFQLGSEGSSSLFTGKSGSASSLPQDLPLLGPETGAFSRDAPQCVKVFTVTL